VANRKQQLADALKEERRRTAEANQGVVKTDDTPTVAFHLGDRLDTKIRALVDASIVDEIEAFKARFK